MGLGSQEAGMLEGMDAEKRQNSLGRQAGRLERWEAGMDKSLYGL